MSTFATWKRQDGGISDICKANSLSSSSFFFPMLVLIFIIVDFGGFFFPLLLLEPRLPIVLHLYIAYDIRSQNLLVTLWHLNRVCIQY